MNGYLATIFPPLQRLKIPLSRDTAALLFVAANLLMLSMETTLAHTISGTIRPNEWIPVLFSPPAGLWILAALWIARRNPTLGRRLTLIPLLSSIVVGILGTWFHLARGVLLQGAPGQQVTLSRLIWSPPLLAPPAYILIGVLGLVALWPEESPGNRHFRGLNGWAEMPFTKSQLYFMLASLGILIAASSSVMDHARTGYVNPWLWAPTLGGTFGAVVAFFLGNQRHPTRADLITYTLAIGLQLILGPTGLLLHILDDLGPGNTIIIERFIRQAPLMAPMLFADMGLLGLIALLDD